MDDRLAELEPAIASRVTLLGRVSDEDKIRALRAVDVYVAPHTGGESFGIVLIEAMAADTPVVASDLPAFRRVLQDGACGALFDTGDAHALAREVARMLTDSSLRERYAHAGSQRVQDFDWERVVDDVIAVYDSVTVSGEKVTEDLRGQIVGRLRVRG